MENDAHERARRLMDQDLIDGIAPADRIWLDGHTAVCAECAEHARETVRMLAGLGTLSFDVDPALGLRVRQAIAAQVAPHPRRWAWIAAAAVLVLGAAPVYRGVRLRQEEAIDRQDAILIRTMDARLAQTVPDALKPLEAPAEETQ